MPPQTTPHPALLDKLERLLLDHPGYTTAQLAQKLGTSPAAVCNAKTRLFRRWLDQANDGLQIMLLALLRRSQWRYDQLLTEHSARPAATLLDKMRNEDTYQIKLIGAVQDALPSATAPAFDADTLAQIDAQAARELEAWEA